MDEKLITYLKLWAEGKNAPPSRIEIWPTYKCNLMCRFCRSFNNEFPRDEVSKKYFLKALKESAELGAQELYIGGGGEPLMKKDVTLSLMKKAKELGMWGLLNTNGILLNEIDIEKIVYMKWDKIVFSIHGPTSDIHDYHVNVRGTFDRVMKNIKTMIKVKKKLHTPFPGIEVWMVLTNKNYENLPTMIDMLHEISCESFLVFSVRAEAIETKYLELKEEDIIKFKDIIKVSTNLVNYYGIHSNLHRFINDKYIVDANEIGKIMLSDVEKKKDFFHIPCYEPWFRLTIIPEGRIIPCTSLKKLSPFYIFDSNIKDVWHGDIFNSLREKILNHCVLDICKRCCIDKAFESEEIRKELKASI